MPAEDGTRAALYAQVRISARRLEQSATRIQRNIVTFATPETLTLLLIIVNPVTTGFIGIGLRAVALSGIVIRDLQKSLYYWTVIGGGVWWALWVDWFVHDNHKFLLGYWCIVLVFAAALRAHRDFIIQRSARLLIAASFLFAVVWKASSPDYLDGRFFEYVLILDPRFGEMSWVFGGVVGTGSALNRAAEAALVAPESTLTSVEVISSAGIQRLARVLTWVVFAGEMLVAMLFIVPLRGVFGFARHWALLGFILGAYAIAPVFGYGWLLGVLGLSDTPTRSIRTRTTFVITLLVLEVYRFAFRL